MTSVPIDPFDASASILSGFPNDHAARRFAETSFSAPVSRAEFLDLMMAQSTINVTIAAALVAINRKDDRQLSDSLLTLLEQSQRVADRTNDVIARLLIGDGTYWRRDEGQHDD